MIRTQIYIPDATYHEAKAHAEMTNRTISQLVREGLELVLQQQSAKGQTTGKYLMEHFANKGKGKAGVNAATSHNDIYDA